MFAAVSSTPLRISSAGSVSCENAHAEHDDRRARAADDPFALEPVGKARGQQRRDRIGERDDEGILQALGDGDAFFDQQRRHPIGKTIEAKGLAEIEHHEQHDERQIGRLEQVGKTRLCRRRAPAASAGVRLRARRSQAPAEASSLRRILSPRRPGHGAPARADFPARNSRRTQITMLPAAPIKTTQRQPSTP